MNGISGKEKEVNKGSAGEVRWSACRGGAARADIL